MMKFKKKKLYSFGNEIYQIIKMRDRIIQKFKYGKYHKKYIS